METEKRFHEFRAVKVGGSDGPVNIAGLVLPYGCRAEIGGKFSEEFRAGSIGQSGDVILNIQHDRTKPVARTGAGLNLNHDADAIRASIDLPNTVYGREAAELVEARILRGFSVEFRAQDQEWDGTHRTITKAELVGIALVDRPAYSDAQIAMRFAELHSINMGPPDSIIRYYY